MSSAKEVRRQKSKVKKMNNRPRVLAVIGASVFLAIAVAIGAVIRNR